MPYGRLVVYILIVIMYCILNSNKVKWAVISVTQSAPGYVHINLKGYISDITHVINIRGFRGEMTGNQYDYVSGVEYISNTTVLVHFTQAACTGGKFIVDYV